jgi:phytoene dehydrogenase-like protein
VSQGDSVATSAPCLVHSTAGSPSDFDALRCIWRAGGRALQVPSADAVCLGLAAPDARLPRRWPACASQVLWRAVERVVPDIRARADVARVGTPLTHRRYLRRHRGSYGPGPVLPGRGAPLPGAKTPIPGLLACGDTTFPGIGLPAVAASGMIAANSLVPVWDHAALLDELGV